MHAAVETMTERAALSAADAEELGTYFEMAAASLVNTP
jgi:hypothetical protein